MGTSNVPPTAPTKSRDAELGVSEVPTNTIEPVSYTHLDVYKRQGLVGLPTTGLRSLIDSLLPSRADVELFCQTNFPNIHRRFVADMERDQKVSLLLLLAAGTGIISACLLYTSRCV